MNGGTDRLRAGVVGLGIGRHHAAALAANPRVELVGLCTRSDERLRTVLGDHPGARGYRRYEEMLARERLDLVSICTPDWLHADMGIAAFEAGAHVICTKPLTTSLEDARRLIAAGEAAGRQLMTGHEFRFRPAYRAIREALDRGLLGDLFYVDIDYFDHKVSQIAASPWYGDPAHPRAAILGTGSHAVDLLRWFAGEVEEAWGLGNHLAYPDFPDDDCMIGVFKMASGAIGKVTQTYHSLRGAGEPPVRIVLHGTRGSIEDDRLVSLDLPGDRAGDGGGARSWSALPPVEGGRSSHQAQLDYFVDCLVEGRPAQPDGRDGARTVAACLAVVEATRTGRLARPAAF